MSPTRWRGGGACSSSDCPAHRLTEVLQALTDNDVPLLAIRAVTATLAPAGW